MLLKSLYFDSCTCNRLTCTTENITDVLWTLPIHYVIHANSTFVGCVIAVICICVWSDVGRLVEKVCPGLFISFVFFLIEIYNPGHGAFSANKTHNALRYHMFPFLTPSNARYQLRSVLRTYVMFRSMQYMILMYAMLVVVD